MFTGIVEAIGTVNRLTTTERTARLSIAHAGYFNEAIIGESISINGACLTLTQTQSSIAHFDIVPETLRRTTLGQLHPGDTVNMERAMPANGRFGGHIVQGHVDEVGRVQSLRSLGDSREMTVEISPEIHRFIVEKGSIAVNGVSLTVASVSSNVFSIALIPHTLASTTLGRLREGDRVNLESDILGKYVARQLAVIHGRSYEDQNDLMRILKTEGFAE